MPKNKGFDRALQAERLKHRRDMYLQGMIARVQTLDKVTITLGRMGMSPDWLADFEDKFHEVEMDFCETISEETKDQPLPRTQLQRELYMPISKRNIDNEIAEYVRADRFVPYNDRYNFD